MSAYVARARRSDGWWAITVDGRPGVHSQSRRLDQVAELARDAIAFVEDIDPAAVNVSVEVELTEEERAALARANEARVRAEAAVRESAAAQRELVAVLRRRGLSVRDVGKLLDLSPQRISQLEAEARRRDAA